MRVNQPFHHLSEVMFKNITSEIKQYYEALFLIIQTTDRMQFFTILQYKLHSFNIQDDRSTRGPLAKPLKKFLSHLYGQPVLTFAVPVFEWILIELSSYIIKNLLCLFFIQWFYQFVIFKSFWYVRHFEYSCMFTERLKTNGTAIKITRETTNNQ